MTLMRRYKNMNCDFWILGYQVQFVKFLPQMYQKSLL